MKELLLELIEEYKSKRMTFCSTDADEYRMEGMVQAFRDCAEDLEAIIKKADKQEHQ